MKTLCLLFIPLALSAQIPNPFGGGGGGGGGGGLSNPMTTTQDIIVGAAGGTPARLGVGSNGSCLVVNGSANVVWGSCSGTSNQLFVPNAQAATYQVVAADFSGCKTIPVASGTFTVTLVASGTQPAAGECVTVINYGSGVVTIARSGQTINGGTASLVLAAASATSPTSSFIISDGTNYEAWQAGAVSAFTVAAVPSWLTSSVATGTTTPALTLSAATGQTSHQVLGTCGSATSFGPCALVLADLPSTVVNATSPGAGIAHFAGSTQTVTSSAVSLTADVSGLLPVANGGTATASPALVAGTNVTITGSWPNQTINSTSGGGTGNAGLTHSVTFTATPTYTCSSASAGTVEDFTLSTALSANVTSGTLATCTTGQALNFTYTQASSGGPYTVVMPTNFDGCPVSPTASAVTTCGYWYDGTNGHLIGVTSNDTPSVLLLSATRAAPTVVPSGGAAWPDSTDNDLEYRQTGGGSIFKMFLSGGDANPVTGVVSKINGTAFSGTSGHLVSFGASNVPADSSIVATNVPLLNAANVFTAENTVQATLASEAPTYVEQVAGGDGMSGTNWTCAFTGTSFFTGTSNTAWSCQHTSGSTATLTNTIVSFTSGTNFDVVITDTAGTTSNITVTAGGFTSATIAAASSGSTHFGFLSSSTGSLVITPGSTYNGTITISVGKVTAISTPTVALTDSTTATAEDFRVNTGAQNNFFAGGLAGGNCSKGCNTNVAVGYGAGANIGSSVNSAFLGFDAGNQISYTNANTGIGSGALRLNISGANNTGLGFNAGRFINDGATSNLAGTLSTFLGSKAYPNIDSDTDETVVGALAIGSGSHTVTLGASTVTDIWMGNSTATPAAAAKVHATDFIPTSAAPGVTSGSTCGSPTVVGNDHYGIITAGAVTTCTLKLTFTIAAAHGWSCQFNDQTTAADTVHQHANDTGSATTNAATIVSGDLINYTCGPF